MGTIRKLSSGKFQSIVRLKGFKPVSKTFASKQDADDWADNVTTEMLKDRNVATAYKTLADRYKDLDIANGAYRNSNERQKVKAFWIKERGGKCQVCGGVFDSVVYDFHHVDPTLKKHNPNRLWVKSFAKIKEELDKCMLVCSNCHRVIHKTEGYSNQGAF